MYLQAHWKNPSIPIFPEDVLEEDAQLELVLVLWLYSYVESNSSYSTLIKPDNHPSCRFCLKNEPGNSSVYMSHMVSSMNSFKIDRLHHYLISQTSWNNKEMN